MLSMSSSTGGMIWRVLCKPASDKIAESIIEPVGAIINRPTAGIALSLQSDVEKDMYVVDRPCRKSMNNEGITGGDD